eukprot:PhF_6_TR1073/c1_g1_i2/m.2262
MKVVRESSQHLLEAEVSGSWNQRIRCPEKTGKYLFAFYKQSGQNFEVSANIIEVSAVAVNLHKVNLQSTHTRSASQAPTAQLRCPRQVCLTSRIIRIIIRLSQQAPVRSVQTVTLAGKD